MIPGDPLETLAENDLGMNVKMCRRLSVGREFQNLRVLIAEDNIVNQKVLVRLLKQIGIRNITVVDNGEKAVNLCLNLEQHFDVILIDKQMPVMDGLEACRLIMADELIQRKPRIVFVTAEVTSDLMERCLKAGCSAFLPKPFHLADIESIFQKLLPE